jgi:hypothetical protein
MDALESFEEIAEQASFHVNPKTRKNNTGRRWGVSPNFEHSKVAREKKLQQPKPAVAPPPPKPASRPASPTVARMISSYDELIAAIRDRVDEMDISRHELDFLAGLATGHSGKLLGPKRVKAFGKVTLGPTLGAIGCKLLLVEDAEQTAKIRARARPRHNEQVRYKPALVADG